MTNTTANLTNINLLNKAQYDAIENPTKNELWAVESPCIVETYQNGTSWYRIWSDGWCEQGGVIASAARPQVITYLKSYLNTNYILEYQINANGTSSRLFSNFGYNKTVSSFTTDTANVANTTWCAKGYIA